MYANFTSPMTDRPILLRVLCASVVKWVLLLLLLSPNSRGILVRSFADVGLECAADVHGGLAVLIAQAVGG